MRRTSLLPLIFLLAACGTLAPLPPTNVVPTAIPSAPITLTNATRVQQIAQLGRGGVETVTWSPDDSQIAVASSAGVDLYASTTLVELRFIPTDFWTQDAAFSPDSHTIAIGGGDTVGLWDARTGQHIRSFEAVGERLAGISFSADGRSVAIADAAAPTARFCSGTSQQEHFCGRSPASTKPRA